MTATNIASFSAAVPGVTRGNRKKQTWKYPYEFAAAHLVGNLCQLQEHVHQDLGDIEVVFDWIEQFSGPTNKQIQGHVIEALEEDEPTLAKRLGTLRWPRPPERSNYIPLQAADL